MNYEQKYKDAMARLELVTRTGLKLDPTYIFPELKDSEDERIRKELINVFSNKEKYLIDQSFGGITVSEALAWLKRQGEQKPQRMISAEVKEALYDKPSWSEEDDIHLRDAIYAVENIYTDKCGKEELVHWLKSIKDRYTWKPSSEQIECLYDAINHYHTNGYPASKLNELYEQMSKIYKL